MKIGLVLEGGANRGVFTAGAIDFLLEQGVKVDYVIGTSAGACSYKYTLWFYPHIVHKPERNSGKFTYY